ncbi:sodium-coupled neutral amino acid transporter 9-like isoform X2 [Coccinella septempunctata]|uniref:sodium-coupled neutral amino acid transporter 9-like isoform X2 n=1 Tax=Coccinella septempunctata TaxID=41139 RepID=UPI001D06514C|nr:sodium-coupled neutral amino acid transporter 9-like isoform X2 [Coccinella septempunctata]
MATEKNCQILSFTQLMDVNFNNNKTVFGVSDTEQSYNGSGEEKTVRSKSIMPISTKILKKQLSKKYSLDLYPSQIIDAYFNGDILSENLPAKKQAQFPYPSPEKKGEEEEKKNSSIVTIFAVWNTMLGSSLLAISWGIEKTGLFPGIILNFVIGAICLYTAYLLLRVNQKHSVIGERCEVPELCKMLIGRWAEVLSKVFSMIVLFGANIVYWILMSNFLYNLVYSIHGFIYDSQENDNISVICPKEQRAANLTNVAMLATADPGPFSFEKYWDLYSTVPVILAFIIFPMLNFKNAQIFMRFNSLGTISIVYLIGFSFVKFFSWGIHWPEVSVVFSLKPTFVALSGMLTMSYFIHNIIISMMKNNRHQENNGRDLTIAFALVTFTYSAIGGLLYISFPMAKWCIEDNILNNFGKFDKLVLFGRALLFFQLSTVFPLLAYMLRKDIFSNLSFLQKDGEKFRYLPVIITNAILVVICISFACFIPRIGTIIRYIGALSGMVYVFMMPNLLNIYSLRKENKLTSSRLVFHCTIIVIGVLNLLSQFMISDD